MTPGTVIGDATTRPPNDTSTHQRLARFTYVPATGVLDPASEYVLIDQIDHNTWHNGGGMFFHPANGFLYLTNGNDANGANDQTVSVGFFGCMVRIDVDKIGGSTSHAPVKRANEEVGPNWPNAYYVPNSNPFVGVSGALEEIYALGLRSPHRATVDATTGRVFIGDVGEGSFEEVDTIEPNDPPGLNFQWHTIEGYNGDLTPPYIGVNRRPIIDYPHYTDGNAVIGGYVYRGASVPGAGGQVSLRGQHLEQYLVSGRIDAHRDNRLRARPLRDDAEGAGAGIQGDYTGISSWGYDASDELYLCQLSSTAGQIYKLQRGRAAPGAAAARRSRRRGLQQHRGADAECEADPVCAQPALLVGRRGRSPRWAVVPNTANIGFTATGEWTWPEGSVLVKHFELPIDDNNPATHKRLETRLLVKTATDVYGLSYKWRADQSDADLVDGALTENVPIAITPVGTLTSADIGAPAIRRPRLRAWAMW